MKLQGEEEIPTSSPFTAVPSFSAPKSLSAPYAQETPLHPTSANTTELEAIANGLMAELRVWDEASNFTPLHPRVQFGNHCYRYAMRIFILHNAFGVSSDDYRISSAVDAIIELGKELLSFYGSMNW